ncbi:MAG TPA: DsrE family protein [Chitinophagaceae bacterium]|nr:DsrE family protein [Chitinophagaceae bacterium]
MKQLVFTILFVCTYAIVSFAQPKPEEAASHNQKYYLPTSLYNDSIALTRAIPPLAEKVFANFSEKEKKDHEKLINYYLLTQDYKKAIESIDSIQKKKDDVIENMEIKIYSNAKISEKSGALFDQAFKQDFEAAFNQLSFRKRVSIASLDTSVMNMLHKDYTEITDKLQKNKSDSLSFEDAQSLCDKYIWYSVYDKIFPLMLLYTGDPKYQMMFPAIKGYKWAGVAPVQNVDELADPNMKYKLLMELTGFAAKGQEATAKNEINGGLGEVGRKVNLHVAAGVPKKNIDLVIVVHAGALFAFLNNEKYKRKYGIDNPNIAFIKELQDFGAKIIVCGQAMTFLRLEMEDLVPGIRQALTAQTVLSTYQLKGYTYFDVSLD